MVGEIERLVDEGASRAEIAVLYRTNAMSRVIEDMLVRREIAYQVIGGTKFYERAEIKDAIAYLSLACQPVRRGELHARRQLPPARARADLARAHSGALRYRRRLGVGGSRRARCDSRPRRRRGEGAATLHGHDGRAARARASRARTGAAELLEAMLSQAGYIEALEAERTIEAQGRIENLEELVSVGREFDATADRRAGYARRLLAADRACRRRRLPQRSEEGLVTLMTLHNAKGLEYPVVFIVGCEDGVFPHSRALDEGGLEEERRLFYVGVTRAMRKLYLTHARRRVVFGAQSIRPAQSLPRRDPRRADRTRAGAAVDLERARGAGGMSWSNGARSNRALVGVGGGRDSAAAGRSGAWQRHHCEPWGGRWRRGRRPRAPAASGESFRLGEDVTHASFGEGVVTAVEPDGVIVVRFARDGAERKLMSELAPVTRR